MSATGGGNANVYNTSHATDCTYSVTSDAISSHYVYSSVPTVDTVYVPDCQQMYLPQENYGGYVIQPTQQHTYYQPSIQPQQMSYTPRVDSSIVYDKPPPSSMLDSVDWVSAVNICMQRAYHSQNFFPEYTVLGSNGRYVCTMIYEHSRLTSGVHQSVKRAKREVCMLLMNKLSNIINPPNYESPCTAVEAQEYYEKINKKKREQLYSARIIAQSVSSVAASKQPNVDAAPFISAAPVVTAGLYTNTTTSSTPTTTQVKFATRGVSNRARRGRGSTRGGISRQQCSQSTIPNLQDHTQRQIPTGSVIQWKKQFPPQTKKKQPNDQHQPALQLVYSARTQPVRLPRKHPVVAQT